MTEGLNRPCNCSVQTREAKLSGQSPSLYSLVRLNSADAGRSGALGAGADGRRSVSALRGSSVAGRAGSASDASRGEVASSRGRLGARALVRGRNTSRVGGRF